MVDYCSQNINSSSYCSENDGLYISIIAVNKHSGASIIPVPFSLFFARPSRTWVDTHDFFNTNWPARPQLKAAVLICWCLTETFSRHRVTPSRFLTFAPSRDLTLLCFSLLKPMERLQGQLGRGLKPHGIYATHHALLENVHLFTRQWLRQKPIQHLFSSVVALRFSFSYKW